MKQLLSKLRNMMKQLLSPETRQSVEEFFTTKIIAPVKKFFASNTFAAVKEFFATKICAPVKQLFLSEGFQKIKERIPEKVRKLIIPAVILILALIIGLSKCSAEQPTTSPVDLTGSVAADVLDVHKKASADSRVLGQLPYDLEIEIVEEITVKDTTWGRIEQIELPDGNTVKSGWIDISYIDFMPDEVIVEELPAEEPEANQVVINMGTVTAHKLNVRKGPSTTHEEVGAYYNGDRVEILETQTVDGSVWGRTNLGWVGMGYVRMDGTAPAENADPSLTTDGNTEVLGYGVVTLRELNVRLGPGTQYFKVRSIAMGARHAYYQLQDGWVRIEDGWVSTEFFYLEGSLTDSAYTASVTSEDLNIRTGPNTSFNSIGKYKQGETIEILALVDKWAYTVNGWVHVDYTEPVKPVYSTGSGTIANGLNIRQEPSADSEIVDTYTTGDRVTVLEVNDNWGRTDKGWINLKYVIYDAAGTDTAAPETVPATT